jgi:hypothetical protein
MNEWEELDVNEVLTLINENVPNPSPELRDQLYGLISATEVLIAEKNYHEWVGLTYEERFLNDARSEEEIEYAKAIEAKLKEKNA